MTRKWNFLLLALLLALSACNLPLKITSNGTAQAWIDAPLDGMKLPLAPYTLVFHSSDPLGVTQMEVSVNGQVLASLPNPDPAQSLVHLTQVWQPQQAGRYVIRVRAQNTVGNWTDPDSVTVLIEDSTPTPTLTPTVTPTVTPTPTLTPTVTPTITPTFTPTVTVAALSFGQPVPSTNTFEYKHDCIPSPAEVTIKVAINNPPQGTTVLFFFRLNNISNWNTGLQMSPLGGGLYQITVASNTIPEVTSLHGASAEFQYQFVSFDAHQAVLLRSQVYSDIQLSPCH